MGFISEAFLQELVSRIRRLLYRAATSEQTSDTKGHQQIINLVILWF
jgi:hypothetical protein